MDKATLQEIERLLTSFAQKQKEELVNFEERITKNSTKIIADTPNMVDNTIDDDFFFDMNSKCAGKVNEQHFLSFGKNLKELMKQFKIVSITALLYKKF